MDCKIVFVYGPSGSGKSTVVKSICERKSVCYNFHAQLKCYYLIEEISNLEYTYFYIDLDYFVRNKKSTINCLTNIINIFDYSKNELVFIISSSTSPDKLDILDNPFIEFINVENADVQDKFNL